jgi:uncharacterized protein (DUF952 family)
MMDRIVHICLRKEWAESLKLGEYSAGSLALEGFIHCSRPEQVLRVANHYFPGTVDLVLLWIEVNKLKVELRWEPSDGEVFPHLYGPLNLEAVVAVVGFPPDPDGTFRVLPEPD